MTSKEVLEKELEFQDSYLARELFGPQEDTLDLLRGKLGVDIQTRGSQLLLSSADRESLNLACTFLVQAYELLRQGHALQGRDVDHALAYLREHPGGDLKGIFQDQLVPVSSKKTVTPKSRNQKAYLEAIREKELVFGIGPAGTGKTYLAVAMAVMRLTRKRIRKLVLARPALEAGEKLGFLPGDILEKVNPYLRPLYDALQDMLDPKKLQEMQENGLIEVAPLAFMRGRTLNNACIILDEAQNTTPEQMKMFLTRIGHDSHAVVTGDITQIDLPANQKSGLIHAREILSGLEEVSFVHFGREDVIRHKLVAKIIQAYEEHNQ
jgi:phosphate starvation-inducible PhoH-like protein